MGEQQKKGGYRKLFYALVIIGVLGAGCWLTWHHAQQENEEALAARRAAETEAEKIPEHIIGGLLMLRPEQIVSAPIADGFQWPCGSVNGAMMYDAQPFGEMNEKRGGRHTGQDLNGIGGQNTDEGLPVYAAGRGMVVYSGEPSPDWGNVVVIAHRLPGQGGVVQTLYAHLSERKARVGEIVCRGERIGSIGTAGGRYLAHLHFEAIPSLCIEAGMPGYHPQGTMNRIDPAELMQRYPAPAHPDALHAVRRIRRREASSQHTSTPTPGALDPGYIPVNPEQFL